MFNEPIFFKPLMFERVWGGNRLGELFGKPIPPDKIIGESWELSDRPDAESVVDGGVFDGWTLRRLLETHPREILGALPNTGRFPLLIKYVDAGDDLSVQVHPDDAGATKFNDLGKTECWVVVRADEGAQVVRGLKPGTTRDMFERAINENRAEELLHYFQPKAGDVIALPPGMVHAIGKGLVVAEVQQNSDVTLRIYDYNRLGLDGKPRTLHVKDALDAIRFDSPGDEFDRDMSTDTVQPADINNTVDSPRNDALLTGKYFDLRRVFLPAHRKIDSKTLITCVDIPNRTGVPRIAMVLEGSGTVNELPVSAGMTGLIPAASERILASGGPMTLLLAIPK